MDPSDFCTIAGKLALDHGQATWRTAVSRAYYALFHEAHGLLRIARIHIKDRHSTHDKIQQVLSASRDADVGVIAEMLRELLTCRKQADYTVEVDSIKSKEEASLIVMRARKTIDLISTLKGDHVRMNAIRPDLLAKA